MSNSDKKNPYKQQHRLVYTANLQFNPYPANVDNLVS
jgi:hypothetical protein